MEKRLNTFRFDKLPTEVRCEIWKIVILEANGMRIVPFLTSGEILATKNLTSLLFAINIESRKIALELYPIAVPIFHGCCTSACCPPDGDLISIEQDLGPLSEIAGIVRVSPKYDIFLLRQTFGLGDLGKFFISPPLDMNQCAEVKHIMKFRALGFDLDHIVRLGHRNEILPLKQIIDSDKKSLLTRIFPNLQSCHYIYFDLSSESYLKPPQPIWDEPGRDFITKWGRLMLVRYGKDLKKTVMTTLLRWALKELEEGIL